MRRIVTACLIALAALGLAAPLRADPPIPPLTGRVVDLADLLSPDEERSLTVRLERYEARSRNEIVVVTLPSLENYPIEDWGLALGRGWGIGKAGQNNGILLILAPKDRQLRIEVGYGLEGALPDAMAKRIIDEAIVPHLKKHEMALGIGAGIEAIIAALSGTYDPDNFRPSSVQGKISFLNITLLLCFLFFIGLFVRNVIRYGWGGFNSKAESRSFRETSFHRSSGITFGRSSSSYSGHGGSFGGGGASGRW